MSGRHIQLARRLAPLVLAGLVSGCATWSEDGGFAFVEISAVNELGARPTVVRGAEEAARAEQSVRDLLAQPLDANRAVRIALINNRGLLLETKDLSSE